MKLTNEQNKMNKHKQTYKKQIKRTTEVNKWNDKQMKLTKINERTKQQTNEIN